MNSPEETNELQSLTIARILVCVVLSLAFGVGVPGNSFVVWTICRRMKRRPSTVILILHLAIADLLVLVTMPIWIYSFANTWLFRIVACKALVFAVYCSMYASIFLITALSLERFVAVFYPFAVQRWKQKTITHLAVAVIWLLSVAFGATIIPFQELDDTEVGLQCTARVYDTKSQEIACLLVETTVGFIIPFAIISICYICIGRRIREMACPSKRRSEKLIASVVVAFGLCWFPHHIFNLISIASALMEHSHPEMAGALEKVSAIGVYLASSVAFVSSCINPLLYAFAARNIRSSVRLTKLSRLLEQMSPLVKQESAKDAPSPNGNEETWTNSEMI
ncbi:leukotriene B4 receptor 1-like [Sceloporus undulatus]|uniref:leukotriene B4 receptor 1-like n=1 Tax=Sceloporus undulatus TaxID=8520 RepID=UPI001C4C8743|nr:leukotriene B4 receptor 1-like [Sceloporus undulatus]